MDFEIVFENGRWPLLCVCDNPADVFCCLMETSNRMSSLSLDCERLMEQLPRLKSDMPIIKGTGFEVTRLDEPQELPCIQAEASLPQADPVPTVPLSAKVSDPAPDFDADSLPTLASAIASATESTPSDAAKDENAGYKGFLYLRCPGCGERYSFFTRMPRTEAHCRSCGAIYQLAGLTRANLACKCGKQSYCFTNLTDWFIDAPCPTCSNLVALEYNPKLGCYRTTTRRTSRKKK